MREFVFGVTSFEMSEGKPLSCEVINLASLQNGN